ncbi:hypothetical protein QH639_22370 [Lysinibacillus sp. 1 U-2021]|uniref:hypothetical protein n=1 Tax=Lysinibacillus sp. 1 U-2021 TaxID=3039426 RepID=UPI00247FB7CA|nr:hypothetical protein [Lysinibacillus sp. 1 U-2021]WGT38521.1 hypothetical protein QH639_22370 [Lysinibacillus sp. 1 U-2021]
MAEKVKRKVSQSVADAMQELEEWMGVDKERSEKVLIVAQLLAYGYEVVPAPEEQLKDYYRGLDIVGTQGDHLIAEGIQDTLRILGIKIKGINE